MPNRRGEKLASVREQIEFHLNWAEVDPSINLLLSDLAPRETWYAWEKSGAVEELFLHTVSTGCQAVNRAFVRDGLDYEERRGLVSQGLMVMSLYSPYDFLPLQAGTLAQMAFDAQMTLESTVTLDDLPVSRTSIAEDHFLAATEAAFGFTLSMLHTYATWKEAPEGG